MKQFISLVIITTLFGCSSDTITVSKKEYQELKGLIPKTYIIGSKTCYILTGEDGHEFISNYEIIDYHADLFVIHSPNCPKDTLK
jgi:hypothetical protein